MSTARSEKILPKDIFQLKKKLIVMSFILRYFLMGVEYSIILPTALLYTKTFEAGPFITGLTIAAYPIAAIVSLPLFGYFYDRTKRLKELLLLLNFFEIIGNLIYALPFSFWLPLLGRFMAGIGDGFIALTVGELTYLYDDHQRLGILSLLELGRVLGAIIGPSFNFLTEGKKIQIMSWTLNSYTLPGVFMAIMWFLMQILTIFCVFNLTKDLFDNNEKIHHASIPEEEQSLLSSIREGEGEDWKDEGPMDDNLKNHSASSKPIKHKSGENQFNLELKKKEKLTLTTSMSEDMREIEEKGFFHTKKIQFTRFLEALKGIICMEFIIVTSIDFILWFYLTNYEILAPLVGETEYMWSAKKTGIIYIAGGAIIMIVFLLLCLTSSRCPVKDTYLLMVSLFFAQMSSAFLIYEATPMDLHQREIMFWIIGFFVFASAPLNLVCSKSLLSKLFHPDQMGVVQGLSSGISRVTMITGPLLSGYIVKDRILYGSITSAFVLINIVGFSVGMKRIHKRERDMKQELMELCKKKDIE